MIIKILKCHYAIRLAFRSCSNSVLYVTGDKASKQVSVVSPYLDFDDRFAKKLYLENNVKARKLEEVDIDKLLMSWELLKCMYDKKDSLEKRRAEISKLAQQSVDSNKMENYRCQGRMVKEELKQIMKTIWSMEGNVILRALKLPNTLNSLTPLESAVCVFQNNIYSGSKTESHLEIGSKYKLIDWRNPSCFYLLNTAALYEKLIFSNISNILKNIKFMEVSNSDFARSIVLEGCGILVSDPHMSFLLGDPDNSVDNNKLHLVGSASLPSFCCLHSKQFIPFDSLPIKYFTVGRLYKPVINSIPIGLFNSWQESAIGVFVATPRESETLLEYENLVELMINLYKKLHYDFKVINIPACQLQMSESMKTSFQIYSPHLETYIEMGYLSQYGSFISKRLLMCYQNNAKQYGFLNVISGTILSGSKFVGCAIENDNGSKRKILDLENLDSCFSKDS